MDLIADEHLPGPDLVEEAARILAGVAHRTPVLTARTMDGWTGAQVFFKCENFQRIGAFKFRGAYHALSRLTDAERSRGVLTWSSGNHGQAVALAGRLLGIPATVVMPQDAPAVKRVATEGYGARVVLYDKERENREELGGRLACEHGLTIVPPYDHPHVLAGQGTAALELFDEVGELDALFVPVGGGGLISGCGLAAQRRSPGCRVIGVEPAAGDDAARSLRSGRLETVTNPATIADGARTPSLGRWTYPLVRRLVAEIRTVEDGPLARTMFALWERMKMVVEPTGALGAAALLASGDEFAGRRVGVVISGGNVELTEVGALRRIAEVGRP
jgi:threonine dehydratase